jgi:putative DNA primase/helicase
MHGTAKTFCTLDDYADASRWVAWRREQRRDQDGKWYLTKIPYDPNSNRQAEIPTNPATWGTRRQAEDRWRQLRAGADDGVGGVGIVLGDPLNDGEDALTGIDLDGCISGSEINEWACEIIERFDSYREISSSGRGVKIFFLVRPGDFTAVKRLMGTNSEGKFKTRVVFSAGKHREIALDWARFYAVTEDRSEYASEALNTVSVADIRWLIEEAGPRFKRLYNRNDNGAATTTRDESGSGYGFRFMQDRKRAGDSYEAARRAILADHGRAGEWADGSGMD